MIIYLPNTNHTLSSNILRYAGATTRRKYVKLLQLNIQRKATKFVPIVLQELLFRTCFGRCQLLLATNYISHTFIPMYIVYFLHVWQPIFLNLWHQN